ncbi:sugar kinase [Jannaschia sp. Os4]|uniref:PfkB family carbohydrate kinase n=1 Tax=Jannaschia sp. Os4 TaxID=2807617 RepID=UPI001939433D|nr:PfkB family carbohydrate kinase [Jannaschia sp. Os4]MBM2576537.1 sugar kinase [Jannaschia sp. Os4]
MNTVLVTGIAVLDHVHRMAALPEGGRKHRSTAFAEVVGGCAAIAALAVARLGGQAILATRLGDDGPGRAIRDALEAEGVDLGPTVTRGTTPISSVMVDDSGERMIVNFPGAGLADAPGPLPGADAILTDTRWGGVHAMAHARRLGVPGLLDGEPPTDPEAARLATHVVFSAPGLAAFPGGLDAVPGEAAVTDGARGCRWRDGDWMAPPAVEVVDTLGAGDVWHGAFALALAEGTGRAAATRFANAAGSAKCANGGGGLGAPTRTQVEALLA